MFFYLTFTFKSIENILLSFTYQMLVHSKLYFNLTPNLIENGLPAYTFFAKYREIFSHIGKFFYGNQRIYRMMCEEISTYCVNWLKYDSSEKNIQKIQNNQKYCLTILKYYMMLFFFYWTKKKYATVQICKFYLLKLIITYQSLTNNILCHQWKTKTSRQSKICTSVMPIEANYNVQTGPIYVQHCCKFNGIFLLNALKEIFTSISESERLTYNKLFIPVKQHKSLPGFAPGKSVIIMYSEIYQISCHLCWLSTLFVQQAIIRGHAACLCYSNYRTSHPITRTNT